MTTNERILRELLKTLPFKSELKVPKKGNRIPYLKVFIKHDGEVQQIGMQFSGVNKCKTFIKWLINYGKN